MDNTGNIIIYIHGHGPVEGIYDCETFSGRKLIQNHNPI